MSIVLDASAALSWIFERPSPKEIQCSDRILEGLASGGCLVPPLWHSEVANALLVGERRGVVSRSHVVDFLNRLDRLPIQVDQQSPVVHRDAVMALARDFKLSAYDATYLELCLRTGSRLASFDVRLLTAMQTAGGEVCN